MKAEDEKLIGHVCVDSGQLILTDPCYLKEWKANEYVAISPHVGYRPDYTYVGACNATCSKERAGQLANALGAPLAVAFSTGYGDGTYPVYATYEDGRVLSVRVDFADERPEEEDDDYDADDYGLDDSDDLDSE